MTLARVPFLNLSQGADAGAIGAAIQRVIDRGWFILGPEVEAFEREFATASGVAYAVGVGNGTDALALSLRAAGIGRGDEVITTPLSAAFTALAIVMAGGRPVFADVDPVRLTIDPAAVAALVGPRTAAILPVHLYGQAADMSTLEPIASRHGLALIEDCCQAHLGTCAGRPMGSFGTAGAFSFYPTKNLGALGDGGAVVTNDAGLAERVRRLRNGGQTDRYHHTERGVNSRLDEIQAAVLRARLPLLGAWTDRRRALAAKYRSALSAASCVVPPELDAGHVYHLFPIRSADRDGLQTYLASKGIETLIHYPVPIPRQAAFVRDDPASCPEADRACAELLSLPLYPTLTIEAVLDVAAAVESFRPGAIPAGAHAGAGARPSERTGH